MRSSPAGSATGSGPRRGCRTRAGCGGGCGCGGGGGCSCGGSPAVGSAAFTRPRFFAGQLLTEDDLEQLTAYITGKARLRNRMLFGPGVVSGLHVVCGPCGGDIV